MTSRSKFPEILYDGMTYYDAEAVDAEVERLRAALEKIACWHVAFPETNYPSYASMAVVTARESGSAKRSRTTGRG